MAIVAKMSDEELIEKIKEGDILSFEAIVRRYQERSLNFLRTLIKDEGLAEEVTQDVFLKIYQKIDRIDTGRHFATYFYTVLKNQAISELRKLKIEIPLTEIEHLLSDDEDLYEDLFKKEEIDKVKKVIAKLPAEQQKVIELYYFSDLSYKEIGRRLGVPIGTVKTNLYRAKQSLEKILKNEKS